MLETHWTFDEKNEATKIVTCDMLKQFALDFKKSLWIDGFVQGNYTAEVSI